MPIPFIINTIFKNIMLTNKNKRAYKSFKAYKKLITKKHCPL